MVIREKTVRIMDVSGDFIYRVTFDVQLKSDGTYSIFNIRNIYNEDGDIVNFPEKEIIAAIE